MHYDQERTEAMMMMEGEASMKNRIKKLCFWVWKNLIQSKGLGLIIYSQLQTQTKTASNPSDKIGRCKNCT
jgi:hypothetical protein